MLLLFVIHIYYRVTSVIRLQKFQDHSSGPGPGPGQAAAQDQDPAQEKGQTLHGIRTARLGQLQTRTQAKARPQARPRKNTGDPLKKSNFPHGKKKLYSIA